MLYIIDKIESNRIICLRTLCVIMVIFLHQYAGDVGNAGFIASGTIPSNEVLQGIQYIVSRIITFSAVPLFFMLSSVLLYAKEFTWKNNMKKKLKSLIVPYFLWITLYILVYFLGQTLPITSGFFANVGRKVSEMGIADFVGAYTGVGGNGLFVNALWFLRDLIILNCLAPVIKKTIDRFPLFCFALIAILWNLGSIPKYLILDNQGVVFFSLGYYIVKYRKRMKQIDDLPLTGIMLFYSLSIFIEFYFYKTGNQLRTAAHSFSAVVGIITLIKITGIICKNENDRVPKTIKIIADYSFFIYASHDFVQTVFKKVTNKFLIQSDTVQMIEYILIPIIVCVVCIYAAVILKRFIPIIYNILTGSREQRA